MNKEINIGALMSVFVGNEGITFMSGTNNLYKEFNAQVAQSSVLDGQISVSVGDKNVLKNTLRKGLNSVIGIIKANYPDTYKQELRDWGFQKEKY